MIEQIINYLYYHPRITIEDLCKGLNVKRQEIQDEFAELLREKYLLTVSHSEINKTGGTVTTQRFLLSPIGLTLFNNSSIKKETIPTNPITAEYKKLFVSHSNKSRKVIDKLIDIVIIPNFELDKSRDIFFTSNRKSGIRSSLVWKDEIQKHLKECKIFIPFIDQAFNESKMCLGEIGAAWVLDKSIHPLIVPPIRLNDFNDIISHIQAENIFESQGVISFLNSLEKDLYNIFGINRKENSSLNQQINSFRKYLRTQLIITPNEPSADNAWSSGKETS